LDIHLYIPVNLYYITDTGSNFIFVKFYSHSLVIKSGSLSGTKNIIFFSYDREEQVGGAKEDI